MVFENSLLDSLTAQGKLSPRDRQYYDLHDSNIDNSQKMLNGIEPEVELTIHERPTTAKLIVPVCGEERMNLYDNDGNVIKQTCSVLMAKKFCRTSRCFAQPYLS